MRAVSLLLVCSLAVACSSDASTGTCTPIRFVPQGTPTFVAARDPGVGSGPGSAWQIPDLSADGTYHVCMADQVEIVEVCQHPDGSFTADEFLALADEVTDVAATSCNLTAGSGSGTVVTVSGSVSEPGIVGIGLSDELGTTSPWDYALEVDAGTYDVIASTAIQSGSAVNGSGGGLLAISRAVAVGSDTTLDVDVATGVALAPLAIQLDNAGSDALAIDTLTEYATTSTATPIALTSDGIGLIAPQTAVAPNEGQAITISAVDASGRQQTLVTDFGGTGGSATFVMLGPLDDVTFGSDTPEAVTWKVLPGYSTLVYELASGGGIGDGSGAGSATTGVSLQRVIASASWQAAGMVSTVAFDTSAPGYQATWTIDTTGTTGGYARELQVELDSVAETLTTAVIQTIATSGAVVPTVRGRPRAAGYGDRGGLGGGALARRRARPRRP